MGGMQIVYHLLIGVAWWRSGSNVDWDNPLVSVPWIIGWLLAVLIDVISSLKETALQPLITELRRIEDRTEHHIKHYVLPEITDAIDKGVDVLKDLSGSTHLVKIEPERYFPEDGY